MNACDGNGGPETDDLVGGWGACGNDADLESVGSQACDGSGTVLGACAQDPNLHFVGDSSCRGDGGQDAACAGDAKLATVLGGSCTGPGACVTDPNLQSVGRGSCNNGGAGLACYLDANLTSVGDYSCNGGGCAGSSSLTSVGDCQFNQVPPAACAKPTITVPSQVTVNATSLTGATVDYSSLVSFGDPGGSGLVASGCSPASPSVFPIGTTIVHCSATTELGVGATASFPVVVEGASDQLSDLYNQVVGLGKGNGLAAKVSAAQSALARANTNSTCGNLTLFISQVKAQSTNLGTALAGQLTAEATQIESLIGC
jgi:hypothetical protein